MFILFVSDIHLCNEEPYVVTSFINFLRYYAINAHALYILGDLFEVWIGDDDPNPLHIEISNALRYLYQNNIPCYFIHGNHDFLLGKKYATDCGMILLPSQKILELFKYRIIILHGDTLCTDDINYQLFRKCTRKIWLQKIFLSLPLSMRLYIVHFIQNKKHHNKISPNLNQTKIKNILLQTHADFMIHGHTHQAKTHYQIINNNMYKLERIVLGSWKNPGSIIEINKHGIYFKKFIIKK